MPEWMLTKEEVAQEVLADNVDIRYAPEDIWNISYYHLALAQALKLVKEIKKHSIVNLSENPRLIIFRIDRIWWEQLEKEVQGG